MRASCKLGFATRHTLKYDGYHYKSSKNAQRIGRFFHAKDLHPLPALLGTLAAGTMARQEPMFRRLGNALLAAWHRANFTG